MTRMTAESAAQAYKTGALLHSGQISLKQARNKLIQSGSFDKESSATHYLNAYRAMREGRCYKRKINAETTEHYLQHILTDHGPIELTKALKALQLHIDYHLDELGIKLHSLQQIHASFSVEAKISVATKKAQEFTVDQLKRFDANRGAFSIVTDQEASKGQITISGKEKELVIAFFKGEIFKGKKEDNPAAATKQFRLYGTDKIIGLTTHFRPRTDKNELQLYSNDHEGFSPAAGDIWFVFQRSDEHYLYIGFMSADEWDTIDGLQPYTDDSADDERFQQAVHASPAAAKQLSSFLKFPRDAMIAKQVLEQQKWQCEIDRGHLTFISKSSGNPYVEAHHLIPLSAQELFGYSLDVKANIVSLCPNCHRLLHHASQAETEKKLEALFKDREHLLRKAGIIITADKLKEFYYPIGRIN